MSVGEEPVVAGNVANSMGLLRNDVQKWIERCRELTAEGDAPRESLREVVQTLEWTVQSLSEALAVFGCGLGVNDAEKVRPTDAAREGLAPHFVGPGVAETAREVHATAEKCSARNTSASQNRKPKRGRLLGEDGTDPYSAWLEIDTPERPLEAYALLGLTLYQENATKIEAGYARKSALLKTVQAAADRRLWNAVSNELRWARDTLLDRTKRAELNASIRRQLALDRAVGQGAEEASPTTSNVSYVDNRLRRPCLTMG